MTSRDLLSATLALVRGVADLIATPHDDSSYLAKAQGVLELCNVVLESNVALRPEAREPLSVTRETPPANLGLRIAELAAQGMGVRAAARLLGVHPSTVSRRLSRTKRSKGLA